MINIKQKIEECKKEGMPDFMIEQHIFDLIEEESEGEEG